MKVRCTFNDAGNLPPSYLDWRAGLDRGSVFPLTIGEVYVVYGLLFRRDGIWYHVNDDNGLRYPMAYPAPLFEVSSRNLSRLWRFALTPEYADHHLAILAIPEWAEDPLFYDRLTSGVDHDVAVFVRAKALMDSEEHSSAELSSA